MCAKAIASSDSDGACARAPVPTCSLSCAHLCRIIAIPPTSVQKIPRKSAHASRRANQYFTAKVPFKFPQRYVTAHTVASQHTVSRSTGLLLHPHGDLAPPRVPPVEATVIFAERAAVGVRLEMESFGLQTRAHVQRTGISRSAPPPAPFDYAKLPVDRFATELKTLREASLKQQGWPPSPFKPFPAPLPEQHPWPSESYPPRRGAKASLEIQRNEIEAEHARFLRLLEEINTIHEAERFFIDELKADPGMSVSVQLLPTQDEAAKEDDEKASQKEDEEIDEIALEKAAAAAASPRAAGPNSTAWDRHLSPSAKALSSGVGGGLRGCGAGVLALLLTIGCLVAYRRDFYA